MRTAVARCTAWGRGATGKLIFPVVLALLCGLPGRARAAEVLQLSPSKPRVKVGRYLEMLADPEGKLTYAQVRGAQADRFSPPPSEVPNFGFTSTTYWFRFQAQNVSQISGVWLLEVAYPLLDHLELFIRRSDGRVDRRVAGDRYPFSEREVRHRNFVFRVRLDAGERIQVHLRVRSTSTVQVPLTFYTPTAFQEKDHQAQAGLFLFYGVMLVMLLYNLLLYVGIRGKVYLYYVLFVAAYVLLQFSLNGLAFEYLWPNSIWWANQNVPVFMGLCVVTAGQFSREFLGTPRFTRRYDRVLLGAMGLGLVATLIALVSPYSVAIRVATPTIVLTVVALVVVTVAVWKVNRRATQFFILAWGLFLVGAALRALGALGVMPASFLTTYGLQFGVAIQAVVLSLALADQINQLNTEKAARERALEVERDAAARLQLAVRDRTTELEQAAARLQEADRNRNLFFEKVSQELRTPLTVVLSSFERFRQAPTRRLDDEAVRPRLEAMERNAQRMARLVDHLQDVVRLEEGDIQPAYQELDLGAFVTRVVRRFRAVATGAGIQLDAQAVEGLPAVFVDPELLDKVLGNLLSNACKYTGSGGSVRVRVSREEEHLLVAVKDTGPGIAEADLPHLFERFHEVRASGERASGSGLGLALAKELTELMAGELRVKSEVGLGTTFTVRLPLGEDHVAATGALRDEPMPEPGAPLPRAKGGTLETEAITRPSRPGLRPSQPALENAEAASVLVIDRSADLRELIAEHLRPEYRVWLAEDLAGGLKACGDEVPALVIAELTGGAPGESAGLKALQEAFGKGSTSLMVLTAQVDEVHRIEALEAGVCECLIKPFEPRELLARTRRLTGRALELERHRARARDAESRAQSLLRDLAKQEQLLQRVRLVERYVEPAVLSALAEADDTPDLRGRRRRLTVFLVELRGFEVFTSALEPEELNPRLNRYLDVVVGVARERGATLDQFVRDRVLGYFGAPDSEGAERDAVRGVELALELSERLRALVQEWAVDAGSTAPVPTVVVHTGRAAVGSFGSEARLAYTAVGPVVDEIRGLMEAIGAGGVLCTQATQHLLRGEIPAEEWGRVPLPHRPHPLTVFRLGDAEPAELDGTWAEPPSTTHSDSAIGSSGSGSLSGASPSPAVSAGGGTTSWPMDLEPESVIDGRYRILRKLGSGGLATVYKAWDERIEMEVALKLAHSERGKGDAGSGALGKEVRLARQITHRNVAQIYDIGEWNRHDFISMEYVPGETLKQRIERTGRLPLEQAEEILVQLCRGLGAAHSVGIVHRDLKPSNVMLASQERVVILDFGIARTDARLAQGDTETRELVGTPHYMSPEQVHGGRVDLRADLYALGAVAFEMVTGRRLFNAATSMAVAFKHVTEAPPDVATLRPDLSPTVSALIMRCLEKTPEKRPSDAGEILQALRRQGSSGFLVAVDPT